MKHSLQFLRIFFISLTIFLTTSYTLSLSDTPSFYHVLGGLSLGVFLSLLLMGTDRFLKNHNLRSFNTTALGLFFGFIMGQALLFIFHKILSISFLPINPLVQNFSEITIFLVSIYLGCFFTVKSADELSISIPFVKFVHSAQKKKDLVIDESVLADSRIIDLAASGLIDHHLVVPKFVTKELYATAETSDELSKIKAKKCIDTLKKLEELPNLGLRYHDMDFQEIKDTTNKFIRLARLLDANILSADISSVQASSLDGIPIINLHSLSNALKPLMQAGEVMKIKVQRVGKEPRQGVGYLDDGTMVVVNGGGGFIGLTIEAQVLSVKHTSSGRMIFCNAIENDEYYNHVNYEEENV